MTGADLDGTVRQPLAFLDWLRDECHVPWLRVLGGKLAAATARRINPHIKADFYITGSPKCEEAITVRWLQRHGMLDDPRHVLSDITRNRRQQYGHEHDSSEFKARAIRFFDLTEYWENDERIASYLEENTKAVIRRV